MNAGNERKNRAAAYLNLLQRARIEPNHFISTEYLTAQTDWEINTGSSIRQVWDDYGRIFPVINLVTNEMVPLPCLVDFQGFNAPGLVAQFYDYEFIYRAGNFKDLAGGSFKTFRKNVNRIDRRAPTYAPVTPSQAAALFLDWAETKAAIDDFDTIWNYLLAADESRLAGCWFGDDLVGFNAWDRNWQFVNFRYCFTLEPYVSEWLRYEFYLSLPPDTLVNDGGALGRPGLETFKLKLQPVEIRMRWSWTCG